MPAPQKHHAKNHQLSKSKKALKHVKKAATERSPAAAVKEPDLNDIPTELQQIVLDLFKSSFRDLFNENLDEKLQEVKTHLFNRDFLAAFGRDELLEAYAVRWSPSRALAYLHILHGVIEMTSRLKDFKIASKSIASKKLNICCMGGAAGAELMSFAALLHLLLARANAPAEADDDGSDNEETKLDNAGLSDTKKDVDLRFSLFLMDIAKWGSVNTNLYNSLTLPPELSKYASAGAKAANRPFVLPQSLSQALYVTDLLTINAEDLDRMLGVDVNLVTIFFTLNEMYTTSRARTQALLLELTRSLQPGALLLVVDSAGSYSTVEVNGAENKYPMHWLLDHTLMKVAAASSIQDGEGNRQSKTSETRGQEQEYPKWEKLREEQSTWFRLQEGLHYPLDLEDMRYQLHLYRRLGQQQQQ